jgi:hypothetical protein
VVEIFQPHNNGPVESRHRLWDIVNLSIEVASSMSISLHNHAFKFISSLSNPRRQSLPEHSLMGVYENIDA